jgi:hypothetical protein
LVIAIQAPPWDFLSCSTSALAGLGGPRARALSPLDPLDERARRRARRQVSRTSVFALSRYLKRRSRSDMRGFIGRRAPLRDREPERGEPRLEPEGDVEQHHDEEHRDHDPQAARREVARVVLQPPELVTRLAHRASPRPSAARALLAVRAGLALEEEIAPQRIGGAEGSSPALVGEAVVGRDLAQHRALDGRLHVAAAHLLLEAVQAPG